MLEKALKAFFPNLNFPRLAVFKKLQFKLNDFFVTSVLPCSGAQPEICNGGCLGGLGAMPPAAGSQWGSGGEAPSVRKFCIFLQK